MDHDPPRGPSCMGLSICCIGVIKLNNTCFRGNDGGAEQVYIVDEAGDDKGEHPVHRAGRPVRWRIAAACGRAGPPARHRRAAGWPLRTQRTAVSYHFHYYLSSRVVSGTEQKNITSPYLPWMS
jgi:hypothetical protein